MNTQKIGFSISFAMAAFLLCFDGALAAGQKSSAAQDPTQSQAQQQSQNQSQAGSSGSQAQSESAGGSQGGQQAAGGMPAGHPPVFVIMPLEVTTLDATMKDGCWVKVFDKQNFRGDSLTLIGAQSISNMSGPFGLNWDDRVRSIQTGPKATVTVFDNQNFRDQVAQFKPGKQVAETSKRMGFFDEFASIKVDCA